MVAQRIGSSRSKSKIQGKANKQPQTLKSAILKESQDYTPIEINDAQYDYIKTDLQLLLRQILISFSYDGEPLFDSVVVNFSNKEEEARADIGDDNEIRGNKVCIIVIGNIRFSETGIHNKYMEATAEGYALCLFKGNDDDIEEQYEKAPEAIARYFKNNRTLNGAVNKITPGSATYELYHTKNMKIIYSSELAFRVNVRFK